MDDDLFSIEEIIDILKRADRIGQEKDDPEGVRYIQISDTLANKIIKSLEDHLEELWQAGIDRMGEDA